MKNLYLCRHGESEYNLKGIIQGHIDTYLTPKGVVQARLAGEALKDKGIQEIYTSDLRRAYQTATIIGDILGIEPIIDMRLREMHFGDWEGKSYQEVLSNHPDLWNNWLKNPVKHPLPNQEDIEKFESRLKSFLNDIKKESVDNILVVAHGGSIQGIICLEIGIGLENLWTFRHTNTGISLIESNNGKVQLTYFNKSDHLNIMESQKPKDGIM